MPRTRKDKGGEASNPTSSEGQASGGRKKRHGAHKEEPTQHQEAIPEETVATAQVPGPVMTRNHWPSASLLPQVETEVDPTPAGPPPDTFVQEAEWTNVEGFPDATGSEKMTEEPVVAQPQPPQDEVVPVEPAEAVPEAEVEVAPAPPLLPEEVMVPEAKGQQDCGTQPDAAAEPLLAKLASLQAAARTHASTALYLAKDAGSKASAKAVDLAKDPSVQATAAGAASGAVLLGAGGATTGMTAGSMMGAAVGVVPAFFTFGLSIPVCAAIGGSAGLMCGAAVGGSAGALTGGAAGYGVYARRNQLRNRAEETLAKVSYGADFVKTRANAATAFLSERAAVARARIVGGGTGGTEALD